MNSLERGRPWPLGAHFDGAGVNFAVFSAHAERVELCIFDGDRETRHVLHKRSGDVWHGYLRGAGPGLVYGLRAHGPWAPDRGQRFNPRKLLLDPYAREIVGRFEWRPEQFGDDPHDNARQALKARVVHEDDFDWSDDAPPATPLADTVLYELHVKGYTRRHPGVPEALRGTYAGLACEAPIAHLKRLGVTAVSLLPVHHHIDEQRLAALGLVNYWGYNTIGFFSVEPRYAAEPAQARDEFRRMVKALHAAGLEVVLDVVFNHSAETDELGPTISFRGLDNSRYYRLRSASRALYENETGCGNTLDIREPRVLQLVMDSLRYWVLQMHVDGFRFDLAPVLGRATHGFERDGPFFKAVLQDPVLSRVKMIAEPWDIGPGGYQLGNFHGGWLEWNDRYRDTMRAFWLGGPAQRGEFAQRLCASSDTFHARGRAPGESVNFIVAHDGFTLRDLLTYEQRRNHANGEHNRDGHGHNLGWNCGVEGETADPAVRARRARLQRALLATLLLSQGTPMLAAGDELGHTQQGNNNPYCQDNPTTWIDWPNADEALTAFTARVLALRRAQPLLGPHWYSAGNGELDWFEPDGAPLHDWHDGSRRALCARVRAPAGTTLLLVNADADDLRFRLPPGAWRVALDTTSPDGRPAAEHTADALLVPGRSLAVLTGA